MGSVDVNVILFVLFTSSSTKVWSCTLPQFLFHLGGIALWKGVNRHLIKTEENGMDGSPSVEPGFG